MGKTEEQKDGEIVLAALHTAIDAYAQSEKTYRQVIEDAQNGREVPAFLRGEEGLKTAKKMADKAFTQAEDARRVLLKLEEEMAAFAS